MLIEFFLLTLLPASFFLDSARDTDDDAPEGDQEDDATSGDAAQVPVAMLAGLAEETGDDGSNVQEAPDQGADFVITLGDPETVLSEFEPGEDHLTIDLGANGDGHFYVEPAENQDGQEIGMSLVYAAEGAETVVTFQGLSEIPEGDISVSKIDPETGEVTLYGLNELGDFGAITPNDPSVPDTPGPADDETFEVLAPNDPDVPDAPGTVDEDREPALSPNLPEDYGVYYAENISST